MQIINLVAACTAISVFGFAFGLSYPLLSLLMARDGVSEHMIGINAAMSPVGVLLFSPLIPALASRYGGRAVAIGAALITAVLMLAFKAFHSLEAWFVIRLVQGMAISTLFILSESWIVKFSGDSHRGRVVAIYGSVLSASFGAGPACLSLIGIDGWTPFVLGAAVLMVGIVPLFLVRDEAAPAPKEAAPTRLYDFVFRAPILLAAVAVFSLFDAATLGLLPVYGLRVGLDTAVAANTLTTLILGNVFLQFPIGWMADKIGKRRALAFCGIVTLVMCLALPWVMGHMAMWPVLVVVGATGYGIYSVALADLGDRFRGDELVAGTSAFGMIWGIGALIGSIFAGWTMSTFGPHGLPLGMAGVLAAFLAAIAVRVAWLGKQTGG